jgi:BolA protein
VNTRAQRIEQCLRERLEAERIDITDDSAQHAGHAGAKQGGHFSVTVVSAKFGGLTMLQRHRLVYSALDSLMKSDVHALSIRALSPGEN